MRILIRTSKLAIWSRRFGSFALPLTIIPVFMHREQMIVTANFEAAERLAMAIACLALLLGLGACLRLWFTGDRGWGRAFAGIFLGLLCLAPLAYGLFLAYRFPAVNDVSTEIADPPVLPAYPAEPRPASEEQRLAAYPDARSRHYALEVEEVFELVAGLVEDRGWTVRETLAPSFDADDGFITAELVTLLGWRDVVGLRVLGDAEGVAVAMRSASLTGSHDLGANGERIAEFMTSLDQAVTIFLRDRPVVDGIEEPADAAPVPAERGAAR